MTGAFCDSIGSAKFDLVLSRIGNRDGRRQTPEIPVRPGLQLPFARHDAHGVPLPEARRFQFASLRHREVSLMSDDNDVIGWNARQFHGKNRARFNSHRVVAQK